MMKEKWSRPIVSPTSAREPMHRVRIGITGLAAIILMVALAAAIASSVRHKDATVASPANGAAAAPAPVNASDKANEPLVQLGVAPPGETKPQATPAPAAPHPQQAAPAPALPPVADPQGNQATRVVP